MNKLFLLSIEECEKYRELIHNACNWWWLRSRGELCDTVCAVRPEGSIFFGGAYVYCDNVCIRPAFKSKKLASNFDVGDRYCSKDNLWIYLGDDIFISKYVVTFSKFDDKSNDYDKSYIKNVTLKNLEDELFTKAELDNIEDFDEDG